MAATGQNRTDDNFLGNYIVDKDVAKFIALTAFRSSADLADLVPFMKAHCDNDAEYRDFAIAVASVSSEIHQRVLQKIFEMHPEIELEFEAKLKKFERIF